MQFVDINYRTKKKEIISAKFFIGIIMFWGIYGTAFNYLSYKAGIIGTFLITIIFLKSNHTKKYLLILSALPFAAIFKMNPKIPSSMIILYIIYIFCAFTGRKKYKKIDIVLLLFLMLIQVITIIIYEAKIINIASFFINIIFSWACMEKFEREQDKELLFKYCGLVFAIAVVLNIIVADCFPALAYIINYDKQIILDSAGRFAALNGDPNYYSQLVLMAIALLLPLFRSFVKEKKYFKSILIVSAIVFLTISGLRSLSKSFVITLTVLIVLEGYFMIVKSSKKILNFIFAPIIIALVTGGVIIAFKLLILPTIEQRTSSAGLLTNREIIWKSYFEMFKEYPLIIVSGSGFSNGMNVLYRYYGIDYAAHNVYIELIADIGVVGVILLISFWSKALKCFKLLFKNEKSLYLWAFLITSLGLSLSSFDALYILLPLIIAAKTNIT